MFCAECGAKVPEGAKFCANCGKPVAGKPATEKPVAEKSLTINSEKKDTGAKKPEKKTEEKKSASGKVVPEKPEASKVNKKPKVKRGKKKLFVIAAVGVVLVLVLLVKGRGGSGLSRSSDSMAANEMAELQEWDVEIKNDVQAAYYHDFVNLIPFYEDVPYVSIEGHGLYPEIRYNWLTMVKHNFDDEYPYGKLRDAYSYVLSDIYVLNGRPEKELEMAQYFYCHNSVSTMSGVNLEADTWNEYDGLLWYMTFLNYNCDIETEEDEYGTLVHVKITNTDMVKLLYEELENTYNMVREDNEQAAAERLNGAFDQVKTYFRNEAENISRLDHLEIRRKGGLIDVSPVYGNSLVSKLNLVELAGGLIFEQAKYQLNRQFWGNLSDDGTLYHYTLSNMLLRMAEGDYDTVNTELSFYAEVDSQGNGYIPFDTRTNYTSFVKADQNWDTLVDILKSKGLAASGCSMGNIQQGDPIYTWGLKSTQDYENMLFWVIMGWRGSIVNGQPVTERSESLGYTGKVEAVSADTGGESTGPKEVIEGKSVFADPDPATGLYEVDGVLYEISGGEAKAVGTVEGFNLTELTLPKEINDCPLTVLGECAIFECDSLISLAIPEGVRVLEKNAAAGNYNLVSISLPSTLTEIGIGAFITDVSLKEIEIPDGITVIEQGTFLSCYSLEELTIPDSVETIGYGAFDACESLHILVPKTTKCEQYAFRQVAEVSYK